MILDRLARLSPRIFWRGIDWRARRVGIDRLCVVLSFDCDRTEDIAAALELNDRLRQLKLQATFAVPGEQLKEGAGVYRSIAASGAAFLNHGYRSHVERRDGRDVSTTFYAQMTPAEIEADIRKGHEAVCEVTGKAPVGFRTPHFGLYQHPHQLRFIHGILNALGYRFSSSSTPLYQLTKGLMWKEQKVFEFPHSGSYRAPLTLFDSFSYREGGAYGRRFIETIEELTRRNVRCVLNYYADPSHIWGDIEYGRALECLIKNNVAVVGYEDLLKLAESKAAI